MAMKKDFKNTIQDREKKKKVEKLTVLKESDEHTIYNLIFREKEEDKDTQPA